MTGKNDGANLKAHANHDRSHHNPVPCIPKHPQNRVNGRVYAEQHELSLARRPNLEFLYTCAAAVCAASWWRGRWSDAE